jgi:hypothetical protein
LPYLFSVAVLIAFVLKFLGITSPWIAVVVLILLFMVVCVDGVLPWIRL